jgi:hypothetical protein
MPLADTLWGDRYAQLEDPFGHRWSVATHKRDVSPEEMKQAMAKMGGQTKCAARIGVTKIDIARLQRAFEENA